MNRKYINHQIKSLIIQHVATFSQYNTRQAIATLSQQFQVPKQVVSGNISWLVRSGSLNINRCKPNSYLY